MLQEERSEQSESERTKEKQKRDKKRVYPSLGRLRKELKEPGEDSESEEDICEDEDIMEEEEEEIIELMEKHSLKVSEKQRPKMATVKQGHRPIAPPPYCSKEEVGGPGCSTFCPEVWRTVRTELQVTQPLAYPVFTDGNQQRYHEPIDFKIVKALAESVRTYGVTAAFTIAQVEALGRYCMTPSDWTNLVRACLSPGQYLDWRAFQIEFANDQGAINRAAGDQYWDVDMLLGQGRFAQQQTGYPPQVYDQINQIAIRAWRSLPNKGEVSGNLTKILQGPMEPFSDFVARMVEAAGRVFGDPDAAMPLIKQLIYEQCTKECRAAITPYKGKGLEVWMKVCRELGGPLTNAGLAAAVMQLTKKGGGSGACFKCGKQGHLKKQCPEGGNTKVNNFAPRPKQPGLCPRCRKGNHWAKDCRSVKDISGQPFIQGYGGARSKNGRRGPRPQGPQIYGAMEDQNQEQSPETWPSLRHPRDRGEPLQAPRGWTYAPPPDSY
ncbi:Retrovirus-related Gag polyprotein [Cricetulus griseus]|uniref:Retrovirus-related Gag polyprotein n=1 Tax=Cricetulus griseus TaxID=10029 RepID=G3H3Y2_CRIGR|nr:Retrovirus-related Gag polyprotein [Cricetulus griseus]